MSHPPLTESFWWLGASRLYSEYILPAPSCGDRLGEEERAEQSAEALFLGDGDLMVQLAFYGDGSGEHGKGTFVVAGYLSGTVDWFDIERLWCAELRRSPAIDYFKATECLHLRGEFEGWTIDAAGKKRERLVDILAKNGDHLTEISSYIRWDDYHSVIGDGIMRQALYHPYFFCFNGVVQLAVEHAGQQFPWYKGRIAFVLDTESNAKLDLDVQRLYKFASETLPEDIRSRMGSTTWDTDLSYPTLQIADLVTWSIRADREKLGSPLAAMRSRVSKWVELEWIPSKIANFVIDTEDNYGRAFPSA